ncbi:MAG: MBL fold metallo-hydrolase [Bradyrhizobiaceae bacterium]|nr:MAG: MBL fold metallo-hydrolase [Bradyrhizobiaceae bacterium]
MRYGGNTSCLEVRCGSHLLILDAGSGLRPLGASLENGPDDIDIFLSHCHIDHLIGLPFFAPVFDPKRRVRVWAGGLQQSGGLKAAVDKLMSFPLFPIGSDTATGIAAFNDFSRGEVLQPHDGIVIRTALLDHPGGATGYRIEYGGSAICYLTDNDFGNGAPDPALVALAKDVSLLVTDTTYTDAELPSHVGWGHSSWQQAVRFAEAANVKTLCLFHHDPDHDDTFMSAVAEDVAKARPGSCVAREGLVFDL